MSCFNCLHNTDYLKKVIDRFDGEKVFHHRNDQIYVIDRGEYPKECPKCLRIVRVYENDNGQFVDSFLMLLNYVTYKMPFKIAYKVSPRMYNVPKFGTVVAINYKEAHYFPSHKIEMITALCIKIDNLAVSVFITDLGDVVYVNERGKIIPHETAPEIDEYTYKVGGSRLLYHSKSNSWEYINGPNLHTKPAIRE